MIHKGGDESRNLRHAPGVVQELICGGVMPSDSLSVAWSGHLSRSGQHRHIGITVDAGVPPRRGSSSHDDEVHSQSACPTGSLSDPCISTV